MRPFLVLVVPVSYKSYKYQTVYKNVKSICSEHIVNRYIQFLIQ